jgi:hypothetical protein
MLPHFLHTSLTLAAKGSKKQVGKHFPIKIEVSKRNLSRDMRIVSIPENSELNLRQKIKDELDRTKEKIERTTQEKEEDEILKNYTPEELEEQGKEQLREMGFEDGRDYDITNDDTDEIQIIRYKPIRSRKPSSSDDEMIDYAEIKRREKALKKHAREWTPR